LIDSAELREVLRKLGAELVLHGHDHKASLVWLQGPRATIPCVGVPSASGALGLRYEPAGYNLYEIDGSPGAWRCTVISRGLTAEGSGVTEIARTELADY